MVTGSGDEKTAGDAGGAAAAAAACSVEGG